MKVSFSEKYETLFSYLEGEFPQDVDTVIVTGGRGASKSYPVTSWASLVLAYFEQMKMIFSRYTLTSAGTTIIPEFQSKIEILKLRLKAVYRDFTHQIVHESNDSACYFKGLKSGAGNQTANLKGFSDASIWIIDEAEELVSETLFDKLQLSVRSEKHHNLTILILNPTAKTHFIYKRFFETPGVAPGFNGTKNGVMYIHTTYHDNNFLPANIVRRYEEMRINNPKKYAHVVLGGWLDQAEGLVFPDWQIIKTAPANLKLLAYGLDFGFANDPTAIVGVYRITGEREGLFFKTFRYETKMLNSHIKAAFKGLKRADIFADSSEIKSIEELSQKGMPIFPVIKGPGSVKAGINKMHEFVCYSLEGDPISLEVIEYVWVQKKGEDGQLSNEPIDKNNHALDAARYAVRHSV